MSLQYGELRPTSGWNPLASLGHPSKFQLVSPLGSVTTRHSSSERQPNFAALNRGLPPIFGRATITLGIGPHSREFVMWFLVMCMFGPPTTSILVFSYHCAKFGWNRWSSFDNMQVLIFNVFGLKMPIHAPNGGFWGILSHKWRAVISQPPKGISLCRNTSYGI